LTSAAIFGCTGYRLSAQERAFFADANPWGFILFRRNVESPDQVRALVQDLRDSVGRDDAPVLIDQEGGRVQRLGPPFWPKYPPGAAYLQAAEGDVFKARELVRLGARLMAHDLHELGINVDCVPVMDVPVPGAHDIIGDRAYARDPQTVAQLGRAAAEGMLAGGVLPIIKHIPGHGRAFADSHHDLPIVETPLAELDAWDFVPFRAMSDMPMAMTAHVVFTAVDAEAPATTSKAGIRLIRERLGFGGLIMTDDLSMQALSGTLKERTEASFKAGNDIVLHCNGKLDEMTEIASVTKTLGGIAARRAEAVLERVVRTPEPLDVDAARARFAAAMEGRYQAASGPDVGEAQAPELA